MEGNVSQQGRDDPALRVSNWLALEPVANEAHPAGAEEASEGVGTLGVHGARRLPALVHV